MRVKEPYLNIPIPGTPEESKVVDYCVHPVTGKFVYMEIPRADRTNLSDNIRNGRLLPFTYR